MDRSDVEEIVSRRICGIETAIPAKVRSVNSDGTLAVVALINKVSVDGIVDTQNLVLDGVKPFVIGNKFACVDFGLDEGAQVMLVSLSRHAREWLNTSSDDPVIPKSPLGNTMNDLVAVPLFRGDRENGQSSVVRLGKDGKVEISSKYGQSIVFKDDGSIEMSPATGKKISLKSDVDVAGTLSASGDVKGTDFKTALLSFNTHIHAFEGVPPGTPAATAGPSPTPSA